MAVVPNFVLLHYPRYWHYDILAGLKVMAEVGFIKQSLNRRGLTAEFWNNLDRSTPMPVLRIDYLADHPKLIPILAEWHHRQWSYLAHATSLGQRIARLRQHSRDQLPISFVALLDDVPVGSAAIVDNDMTDQESLSPWLANVYVVSAQRRQGIGARLVQRAAQQTRAIGYRNLYLYTEDQEHFYAHLGWQTIDRRLYRGYLMSVMALDLDTPETPHEPAAASTLQKRKE